MLRGVSYAFFVRNRLHITDAFGQEHRIHNFVSCHGADVTHQIENNMSAWLKTGLNLAIY